jgi:hypothetical protein
MKKCIFLLLGFALMCGISNVGFTEPCEKQKTDVVKCIDDSVMNVAVLDVNFTIENSNRIY